jgi:hypothetical protein
MHIEIIIYVIMTFIIYFDAEISSALTIQSIFKLSSLSF